MPNNRHLAAIGAVFCVFLTHCSLRDEGDRKGSSAGLIVTPVASYSTFKARNLAQKYKDNLERLVVEVVRNPTTAKLQFANNIVSTGGIGFFTHSASQSGDERYLELILAVPEVFEEGMGLARKIDRLMSQYGGELCGVLLKESAIYADPEVAGYGLNFFWRSAAQSGGNPQIVFERAVLYLKKDEARRFLDQKLTRDALLSGAIIFATRGDNPPQQIAYAGSAPSSLSSPAARQEKPAEAAVAALNTEIKEKDLSSEKEKKVEQKEQKAASQTKAAKNAEMARAPRSETRTKQPVESKPAAVQDRPAKERPPDVSGKPASIGTEGKADQSATKAADRELAEVKSTLKDPASTRASGETSSPASQSAAESVIASAKKPAPASSAEKSTAPLPSPGPTGEVKQQPLITKEATPQPKAAPVEQPQIASPAKVPIKDKPEKMSTEAKAPSEAPQSKTDQASAKLAERRTPEAKAELKDTGSTKAFSEANSLKTQSTSESGIASAKKPAPPPTAEKRATYDAEPAREVKQPTSLPKDASSASKQVPLQSKAVPAEQTQTAAPSKEATKEKAEKARVEAKPQTESAPVKEAKAAPRQTPEQARAEVKLSEPTARKDLTPKAEPIQEATLRKDLPQEVRKPGAPGSGAGREEPQLPKDSLAKTEAVPPKREAVKERAEPVIPETKAQPDRAAREKVTEEAGKGQLALKSVEGYVIQISFPHKTDAQRWSEVLSREGYTTSITSIGEGESVRLRVGSFPSQALANNLLARLKKDGLNGFVVQVPKG